MAIHFLFTHNFDKVPQSIPPYAENSIPEVEGCCEHKQQGELKANRGKEKNWLKNRSQKLKEYSGIITIGTTTLKLLKVIVEL